MKKINYSFIIPHKNSLELLERCLNSIPLDRTDIEVIVIDDNSTITEREFDLFSSKYTSVKLIRTNEGKGAGYARNIGLEKANGKWIIFADADDFFLPELASILDDYAESNEDIIFFNTKSCYSTTLETCENRIRKNPHYIEKKDVNGLKWDIHVVWGKIYSSKIIKENNIYFDEIIASNDVMFVCYSSNIASKISIDSRTLYCSTVNLNSLCYKMNITNLDARMDVLIRHNIFLKAIKKEKYLISGFSLLLYYKEISYKIFIDRLLQYIKRTPITILLNDLRQSFIKIFTTYRESVKRKKLQKINLIDNNS